VQVYDHMNLSSFAGCYYVTVVDRSGNESAPSNIVCQDNCPYYALPNVITPDNGDTLNQVFEPYPCPRFIESGKITILNRWGRKVFETSDIHINWAGGLNNNAEVSDANNVSPGVYYYSAELKTMRLRRRDERIVIKGWVHILK
ncbi:gliding motility-associated C-terminal domain-containing protein, partial [Xanthocytophaga agilis]